MPLAPTRTTEASFKPSPRLIRLLGEQMIPTPHAAVLELVKNSHDADATEATVTLRDITDSSSAQIVVTDDGSGMTLDTVVGVWLEPGTDFRTRQKAAALRTPRFGRIPAGNKGVGRFAAHKLGATVEMVTRAADALEVSVEIDWDMLERSTYLEDAEVAVTERIPEVFTGDRTGTRITVGGLTARWDEHTTRALSRALAALMDPAAAGSFKARVGVDPDPGWGDTAVDPAALLALAAVEATARVDPDAGTVTYQYAFTPAQRSAAQPRSTERAMPLDIADHRRTHSGLSGVGPFTLDLRIFDDPQPGDSADDAVAEFLSTNSGIRVYRNGIRVHGYGEAGNDWLGLTAAAIDQPRMIGDYRMVGAIHLDAAASSGLIEQTNRDGFVASTASRLLRAAARSAIQHIVFEYGCDSHPHDPADGGGPISAALDELHEQITALGAHQELGPLIEQAVQEYDGDRERLLVAAGSISGVETATDELQAGITDLNAALHSDTDLAHIKETAQQLEEMVDSLGFVARRSDRTIQNGSELAAAAIASLQRRLAAYNIDVRDGFTSRNDFTVTCQRRLIVGALANLLNNAIGWLDAHNPDNRKLYVGPTRAGGGSVGIVVADNGPGIPDPAIKIIQPFATRKTGGTGLGLYIASEVMRSHNGRLAFPAHTPVDVPAEYDGACAVLVFDPVQPADAPAATAEAGSLT